MFEEFQKFFLSALLASMLVVRKFQSGAVALSELAEVKKDGTLKGECDVRSGLAALATLKRLPAIDFELRFEDINGRGNNHNSRFVVHNDNLDGTRVFTNGGHTSAVILAVYDRQAKQYVSCFVGEPASGRIWYADTESRTRFVTHSRDGFSEPAPVHVYNGELNGQATVFVDPFEVGFPLGKTRYSKLLGNIMELGASASKPNEAAHVMILGSNGLHQALVANGWQGAVGGIMTAKGGPWDAAGALLVKQAGGAALGFKLEADGTLTGHDALDPDTYDFLVYGNTAKTVRALAEALRNCIK